MPTPLKQASAVPFNNVDYVLPEVEKAKRTWRAIRDCIDGQDTVKDAGTIYVPMPNATDQSSDNIARFDAYLQRGLFVNFTARTLNGMVGTAFSKQPVATLPESLEVLHEDVDGGAVSLDQQAKQVLSDALGPGRCGLLADFPSFDGPITRDLINRGEARPVIQFYFAEDIINWKYTVHNSLRLLSLVVLVESYDTGDGDEFKRESEIQWRILRLTKEDSGLVYSQEVVRNTPAGRVSQGINVPKQANGQPFDYIPFEFVGARNNDGGIDEAPLRGIADINIAHFRNSCDFEEMVFVLGQPTTVITGLTQSWATDVLGGKVVMGSTSALMLPEGATATYLEVTESQIALKAMEHKEGNATAIGARLVNDSTVQRTAKEAGMDDASEQSVLLAAVNNVNAAYRRLIQSCALFAGAPITEDMGYQLNTDFEIMQLDQAAITARVKLWIDGAITWTECRSILRRAGITSLEDEEAKAELDKEAEENRAAFGMGGELDANGNPIPPAMNDDEGEE